MHLNLLVRRVYGLYIYRCSDVWLFAKLQHQQGHRAPQVNFKESCFQQMIVLMLQITSLVEVHLKNTISRFKCEHII